MNVRMRTARTLGSYAAAVNRKSGLTSKTIRCIPILMVGLAFGAHAQTSEMGAGTEGREWLVEELPTSYSGPRVSVNMKDAIRIEMRDGITLEARLFKPVLPDQGPPPCIVVTNGYGITSGAGAQVDFRSYNLASRGYAVLHVSLRGSGDSEGENDLYAHYGEDGYDVVEWMADQPWCNGDVAMMGTSLLGISQWLTAREAPPSLRAITPHIACGNCYDVLWYPGGMRPGPGRKARHKSAGAESEYDSAIKHRNLDDWWRERSMLAKDHVAIAERGVAAMISGGFNDYITPGNIRAYEEFEAAGVQKALIVGPWAHAFDGLIMEQNIAWFDRHLRGIENGVGEKQVLIYIRGPDRWRYEDDWPIADAYPVQLYFNDDPSGTIASINDGSLSTERPGESEPARVSYSPDKGPFLLTMLSSTGRLNIDQTPSSETALTWTTGQLDTATEVTGYPRLTFWAESSAEDADAVLNITDVAPDGSSIQVVQGYLNLPRAADRSSPAPLTPGKIAMYEIEAYPTAYVFQAGHRIRVSIAGGTKPAPNQQSPQGPGPNPTPFELTIRQDAEHPTVLELPVIGVVSRALTSLN